LGDGPLDFLALLPGVSRKAVRRLSASFGDIENLAEASVEEIAATAGIPVDIATRVREAVAVLKERPDAAGLNLCPSCGLMVASKAKACPHCGMVFEGIEEGSEGPAAPPAVQTEEADSRVNSALEGIGVDTEAAKGIKAKSRWEGDSAELSLCSNCGGFLAADAKVCATCGVPIEEEGTASPAPESPPVEASATPATGSIMDICLLCGAFNSPGATECRACKTPLAPSPEAEPVVPRPEGPVVIPEGFMSPPPRPTLPPPIAPAPEIAPPAVAREEPERVPESPPPLAPVTSPPPEPVKSEPEPVSAEDVSSLEELIGLVPPEKKPVPTDVLDLEEISKEFPEETEDRTALLAALERFDRLIEADPSLKVAHETRAELLRKMGREDEAVTADSRAHEIATWISGTATSAVGRSKAASTGRVNGLGSRPSGMINGTGGRVNGVRAQGRVNGMAGSPGLRGLTNGLVNGDGFVNGRRGAASTRSVRGGAWARSLASVALTVAVLVLLPLLVSYLAAPPTLGQVSIDGSFDDWAGTRSFRDAGADVAYAPSDLLSFRLHRFDTTLSAYVEANGTLFTGRPPDGVDAVLLFVDSDADPSSGYSIGALGADYLLEVWGWNDTLQGNALASWRGGDRDDFAGFVPAGDVLAAVRDRVLEMQAVIPSLLGEPRALLVLSDNVAEADASAAAAPQRAALVAAPEWTAPDVITTPGEVLRLDLDAPGGPVALSALVFQRTGTIADAEVLLTLHADDGDGVWTPSDPVVDFQSPVAGRVRFAVADTVETTRTYFVSAQLGTTLSATTLGLVLDSVEADAVLTILPSPGMSYVGIAPSVTADGAFGDWAPARLGTDPIGDVLVRGSGGLRTAIDLRTYGLDATPAQVAITLGVRGRILGGVDLPGTFERPAYLVVEDHDRDSVPDGLDLSPDDFNNDNVTDALSGGDVDGDGLVDYDRGGVDVWINTTLPAWFPVPYANRTVTLFLGDIAATPLVGADTAVAYIDADGDPATGLPVSTAAGPVGADFAIEVRGRAQRVIDSGLFAYAPGPDNPWRRIGDVTVGMDAHRLEVAFPAALANLSAAPRVAFRMRDAGFSVDTSDGVATRGTAPPPSPTNPGGTDVVINEVSAATNPEWVEIANPTNAARNMNGCTLERRQGGGWTTVYTFTQTIGAWGSGTEYLAVNLPSNSLPNGGSTVRILCAGTEIDRTAYSGHSSSESWARFKDPSTGKPMDSDNDAADFYIDTAPTSGQPNTRHRPTIAVAKTVNKTATGPGDTLVYTIYYNNTDTGRANTVWINDTLPANTLFVSSSVAPSSSSGQLYRWVFTNVGPNTANSLTITVRVDQPPNNALLVNTATLQYVDQLNRGRPGSQAWANATSTRPVIAVAKISDVSQQVPGGFIVYTVYYNNTGSVAANNVWINDTLPSQVTFISSSVAPSSSSGQTYRWSFAGVAVGAHSFTITVQVNANATWGDAVNWAFLNYTSQFGFGLATSAASATVYIGEYDFVLVAVVLPGLALLLRRSRRGRPTE